MDEMESNSAAESVTNNIGDDIHSNEQEDTELTTVCICCHLPSLYISNHCTHTHITDSASEHSNPYIPNYFIKAGINNKQQGIRAVS